MASPPPPLPPHALAVHPRATEPPTREASGEQSSAHGASPLWTGACRGPQVVHRVHAFSY
jgi:hypothetical protein